MSWDEQPPLVIRPQTAAQIVLGGFELAGIILVFCLVSGLAYGGYTNLARNALAFKLLAGVMIVLRS